MVLLGVRVVVCWVRSRNVVVVVCCSRRMCILFWHVEVSAWYVDVDVDAQGIVHKCGWVISPLSL